jgi:N-acetylmuramoyl-L-alanine amidase
MRVRSFSQLGLLVGLVTLGSLAYALPPSSDLSARDRRSTAPRATRVAPAQTGDDSDTPAAPRSSTVVVIDAGHGGFDRGGIPGQRVAEKTMNLDVALRLRTVLTASGYRVVMTRSTDVFVPLGTRVAIANSYSNAIFVCVHFNSATRRGANGVETYFYSQESLPLASAIHYNVVGSAPSSNRGVRRRGYYVLRKTRIPAVLVECGFLTNPSEAEYAQSAAYRQKLAEAIARGVRSRGSVSRSSRVASAGTVPLQPFIDQTRVHDPDLSSKRSSKKGAKSKSSKSKKSSTKKKSSSSDEDSSSSKKKSSSSDDSGKKKKKSSSSDDSSSHGSSKKKSSPKTTEE